VVRPVAGQSNQTVVKAQKIEPGTTDLQMHYPRLGFLRFQTELSQQRPQPRQGGLGLLARSAHHQRVVGETDQHSMLAHAPSPVNPMQVHVTQQRADHTALWRTGHGSTDLPVLHHASAQNHAQQFEYGPVADAFLDRLHQPFLRYRREAVGDIRLDHPPAPPPGLIDEYLQGIVRATFGPETERTR
jgi:hypothetical protein